MNLYTNLTTYPHKMRTPGSFVMAETDLEPVREPQVLVRNLFMSVDYYLRSRMYAGQSSIPAYELVNPLEGGCAGEVIQSWATEFKAGHIVTFRFGWLEYFCAAPQDLHPVSSGLGPLSVCLGVLSMPGMPAWEQTGTL